MLKFMLFFTLVLAMIAGAPKQMSAEEFRIIALGDLPYGAPELVYPPYEALIGKINEQSPDLVIHVGDTKGGGACTDQILLDQLNFMNSFEAPVLYTPGDNEWTDCFSFSGGIDDPLDRLAFIRRTYFSAPELSLGQSAIALEHQDSEGYPENARFRSGDIGFLTAHIVGSNNNFETRNLKAVEEYFARSKTTTTWLQDSFTAYDDAKIIVVAIHADMFEFDFNMFERERWLRHSGFGEFGEALKTAAQTFEKPVLLLFGDSHKHRVFQPFPKYAPNITGVEVYGYPDMHAVEVTVRPDAQEPFSVAPVWNPGAGE